MALPIVKTLQDCADFSKTVAPYLPQLYSLPQQISESITRLDALKQVYLDTNPVVTAFAFTLFLVPVFVLLSEINKNYSQVDRCWSILPSIYNAHYAVYAHAAGLPTQRLDTVLAASTIWSLRLTYNYWRRGGYSVGSEDYRWEIVRKDYSPPQFFLFNVGFISFTQSLLLFLITTPTYTLLVRAGLPTADSNTLTTPDLVFSRIIVSLVFVTFFADQQQWKYQEAKAHYRATAKLTPGYTAEDLDRGFVASGLWSWSRHPNFVAEQAVWVTLYLWACYSTETFLNWTGVGVAGYLTLFQASTQFTEKISAGKYPEYKEYQARVGKLLPRLSTVATGGWRGGKGKKEGDAGEKEGRRVISGMAKDK